MRKNVFYILVGILMGCIMSATVVFAASGTLKILLIDSVNADPISASNPLYVQGV